MTANLFYKNSVIVRPITLGVIVNKELMRVQRDMIVLYLDNRRLAFGLNDLSLGDLVISSKKRKSVGLMIVDHISVLGRLQH